MLTAFASSRFLGVCSFAAVAAGSVGISAACGQAFAQEPVPAASTALSASDAILAPASFSEAAPQAKYGVFDTTWWNVTVGGASDFDDIEDVNASIGISYFAANDVEVGGDLLLRYIVQDGNDAFAINPQIYFRWHFLVSPTLLGFHGCEDAGDRAFTAFLEAGIGPMFSTDDVPPPATSTNFTPRVGAGITAALNDNTRLLASLRWSHVSNADILGNDDNVGSDGVMLTIGCVWAW